MDSFSGGMLRKASLARCLSRGARLVMLDEPTNHLDLDTIEWLESLLRRAAFGFILVTHDRYFLDAVCASIMEIEVPPDPASTRATIPATWSCARSGRRRGSGPSSAGPPSSAASLNG